MTVRIEKISDEIHRHVLSPFGGHRRRYEKIIVAIVRSLRAATDVTISNVLLYGDLHVRLIVVSINDLKSTQCT